MKNVNCPHCGGQVIPEDRLAGQVVSCPGCKKPFQMPAAPARAHFAFEEQPAKIPVSVMAPPALTGSAEPWYHRLLERHVLAGMWTALTVLGLLALALVVLLLVSLGRGGATLYIILAFVICLSLLVLILLAVIFGTALVLLALDNARNIREMRRNVKNRS